MIEKKRISPWKEEETESISYGKGATKCIARGRRHEEPLEARQQRLASLRSYTSRKQGAASEAERDQRLTILTFKYYYLHTAISAAPRVNYTMCTPSNNYYSFTMYTQLSTMITLLVQFHYGAEIIAIVINPAVMPGSRIVCLNLFIVYPFSGCLSCKTSSLSYY